MLHLDLISMIIFVIDFNFEIVPPYFLHHSRMIENFPAHSTLRRMRRVKMVAAIDRIKRMGIYWGGGARGPNKADNLKTVLCNLAVSW